MKILFLVLSLISAKSFAGGCGEHVVAKCAGFFVVESICPLPETPSGPESVSETFSMVEQQGGPKVDFSPVQTNGTIEVYKLQKDFFTDLNLEIDTSDRSKPKYSAYTIHSGVNSPSEKCESLE